MTTDGPGAGLRTRSTLPILFSVIIIDLIGFGIVLPILPFYAKAFQASGLVLGAVMATHAAMQFIFAPIWGRLSDRIGRRPVMLMTMVGTSGALFMLGMAESLAALFIARALSGAFAANISVATAYVSDVTEESERTRWMGMVGASFGIGFLLGPAIGGFLAPYGREIPMFVAGALAAANAIHAAFSLKAPQAQVKRVGGAATSRAALADPNVFRLCAINFLFTLGVAQLETIFAYLMIDRFEYDERGVAFVLVAMALVMALIQGGGMRSLAKRYGEKTLLLSGLLLMAAAFPFVPNSMSVGIIMIPLLAAAIGRAIAQPPMPSLVSMHADPAQRGSVMGAFQSAASLARIFGPIAAGVLYDLSPSLPFYLASVLLAASAVLGLKVEAHHEPDAPAPV
jgi:DHA1 family tetracycline resistance protein-like MFS transporter